MQHLATKETEKMVETKAETSVLISKLLLGSRKHKYKSEQRFCACWMCKYTTLQRGLPCQRNVSVLFTVLLAKKSSSAPLNLSVSFSF